MGPAASQGLDVLRDGFPGGAGLAVAEALGRHAGARQGRNGVGW